MKKIFFILSLSLMMSSFQAQTMRIGLTGGVNITSLMCSNLSNMGDNLHSVTTFSPTIGGSCLFKTSPELGWSLGLMYSAQNQKYSGTQAATTFPYTSSAETFNSETKISYIDVPILFRYYTPIAVYVELGPQVSMLVGGSEDRSWSPASAVYPNQKGVDFKTDFNGFNCEAILGLGYTRRLMNLVYLDIGLRAGYGLIDVTNQELKSDWQNSTAGYVQHSVTSTVANFDKFDFASGNSSFKYSSTNRFYVGMLVTICFMMDNPLATDTNGSRSGAGF